VTKYESEKEKLE